MTEGSVELNWLCKHMKKVTCSQAPISINSCIELSKTHFSPVSIVNGTKPLSTFAKHVIFDVWIGFKYAPENDPSVSFEGITDQKILQL